MRFGEEFIVSNQLDTALTYFRNGFAVIPMRADGTKRPACEWTKFEKERPSEVELRTLFGGTDKFGFGIICGKVSNDLEVLDFDVDGVAMHMRWCARLRERGHAELVERLVTVKTPRPGVHVYYRCPSGVEGHLILAQREISNGKVKTLIETRGEGCLAIAPKSPPEVHPSGRTYEVIQGNIFTPPDITAAERKLLLDAARELTDYVKPKREQISKDKRSDSDDLPGDDFNERGDWDAVLLPHGWTKASSTGESKYYRHPHKSSSKPGHCAVANFAGTDLLHVFCDDGGVLEQDTSCTKFYAVTVNLKAPDQDTFEPRNSAG